MAPVSAVAAGPVKIAIAIAAITEEKNEKSTIHRIGNPPFLKSSSVNPCSSIHGFPRIKGEYQKLPIIRFTIEAIITAQKLICVNESGNMPISKSIISYYKLINLNEFY